MSISVPLSKGPVSMCITILEEFYFCLCRILCKSARKIFLFDVQWWWSPKSRSRLYETLKTQCLKKKRKIYLTIFHNRHKVKLKQRETSWKSIYLTKMMIPANHLPVLLVPVDERSYNFNGREELHKRYKDRRFNRRRLRS